MAKAKGSVEEVEQGPYRMSIGLNVLKHLGINLYSNAAAVLSEAVANSWDAEAEEVFVELSPEVITILDDGNGMTLDELNDRFLNVGYDKRRNEGDASLKKKRNFMGRKGIGKLSLFSIANTVEIYTAKKSERHAFKMTASGIEKAINSNKTYYPEPIEFTQPIKRGTYIFLSDLKKERTGRTASALRKRVARRFSVIGLQTEDDRFSVYIDNVPISRIDREDLRNVEFLWQFDGPNLIGDADCPSLKRSAILDPFVADNQSWRVSGWLGAVESPSQLSHDDAGALNNVVVLARGRLIQENILDNVSYSRLLRTYLTGEIRADFLDFTNLDDIATSDRQRLIEDDERYRALLAFLRANLLKIQDTWTKWRNEARGKDVVDENPALQEWLETLPPGQRVPAQKMLGVVRGVEIEDEDDRIELYKTGVLAFERLRLREESHKLGELDALSAKELLPLLADLASLEGSLYLDIIKSRLDVISQFENMVDNNEREKILQDHLFKNLWLLDAGWERATGSERIEKSLKADYKIFSPNLSEKESKGRYDIRYRTNGGMHILVELKRANRTLKTTELLDQGQKYFTALKKCLKKALNEDNPLVSIVFVLGKPVVEEGDITLGPSYVNQTLKPLNARVVYYEQLIENARSAYSEYIERYKDFDRVEKLVKKLKQ
ncbi:BbrUII/HgiDII family restriction enzyme [Burkholderia glumae]|uniref:BbrUII/HgiDII family restriction enzyme n=1 Tax=Burkholderia glumae TaxID=337 RepID=UPI001AE4813E|nr:ATP-binding protein [Burkholderia glumae]QTP31473.1 hypothetical protein B7759_00022 [Burkholderia glumae]QTP31515.1 hypothetical protein B7759_00064 [Burkholderia glumae]